MIEIKTTISLGNPANSTDPSHDTLRTISKPERLYVSAKVDKSLEYK